MSNDTQTIKYRLIGALVVLMLFVLVWWLFLDHDVKRYQDTKRGIPEPLQIERFDVAEAKPVQTIEKTVEPLHLIDVDTSKPAVVETVEEVAVANEQAAEVAKPAQPAKPALVQLDEQGRAEAWVVQAASFENQDNARQLQQRMLNQKLPAYIKVFNLPEGKRYRVLLGPKLSKQKADNLLPQLKKDYQIEGRVLRYQAGFEE